MLLVDPPSSRLKLAVSKEGVFVTRFYKECLRVWVRKAAHRRTDYQRLSVSCFEMKLCSPVVTVVREVLDEPLFTVVDNTFELVALRR